MVSICVVRYSIERYVKWVVIKYVGNLGCVMCANNSEGVKSLYGACACIVNRLIAVAGLTRQECLRKDRKMAERTLRNCLPGVRKVTMLNLINHYKVRYCDIIQISVSRFRLTSTKFRAAAVICRLYP